jgi:ankyrin repeat protein
MSGNDLTERLAAAIRNGHWDDAERFRAEGADPNGHSGERTVLQLAVEARNPTFVRRLLDAGADPNGRDRTGDTPLFFAARADYPVEMRILIEAGADPTEDNAGWTPLRRAARDRNVANFRILLNAGARIPQPGDPDGPWAAELDAFVRDLATAKE